MNISYNSSRQVAILSGSDDHAGGRSRLSASRGGVIRDNAVNSIIRPPLLSKRARAPPPSREVSSQYIATPSRKSHKLNPVSSIASHAINAATIAKAAVSSAAISAASSVFTPSPIQPSATTVINVFNNYNFNVYTQPDHEAVEQYQQHSHSHTVSLPSSEFDLLAATSSSPASDVFLQRIGTMASSPVPLIPDHVSGSSATVNFNFFQPPPEVLPAAPVKLTNLCPGISFEGVNKELYESCFEPDNAVCANANMFSGIIGIS